MTWEEEFITKFCNDHNGEVRFLRGIFYDEKDGAEEIMAFIQKTREDAVREALDEIHTLLNNGKTEEAYRLSCNLIQKHRNI